MVIFSWIWLLTKDTVLLKKTLRHRIGFTFFYTDLFLLSSCISLIQATFN